MAKQAYKKPVKKRGMSICTGCIEEFKNVDLTVVRLEQTGGMIFSSVFCEKCVKKEQFPQNEKFTIVGPAAKPRKARAKKVTTKKVTTKK